MFRYVVTYSNDNLNNKHNYDTVFQDIRNAPLYLGQAAWHLNAKW